MADDAPPVAASKPQKPDEAAFKQNLAQLDKEHKQIMDQYNAVKQKIDLATPNKNSDNPTQKRRAELIAQLNEIKQKQGAGKNSRNAAQEQVRRLDEQLKAKKNELKASRDLVEAKSEEELDHKIKDLDLQVERGNLSLVDEKKTLERIGKMKRSRKQFTVINKQQEDVDALQAKIQETKAGMSNPESKALSEQYTKLQAELDSIKAEQDEAYKSLSQLRDERSRLQGLQKEKWSEKRKLEDEYHTGRKAFQKYERDQKQKAWERSRAERERIEKERKMERAQKILAEASDPAYLDEIRQANSLLHFFDPSHVSEKAPLQVDKGLGAQANRKVDDSAPKGMKIVSKKEREEELFPAATKKKGGKGKKNNAAKPASSFNCPPVVLADCAAMGIDPPMSAEQVPAVIEEVKAKLDHWKSDQEAQTQRNIEKAKKEIEKLEAEETKEREGKKSSSSSSGAATPATPTNGDAATPTTEDKTDEKIVEDVANDITEKASLEDKKEAVAAA